MREMKYIITRNLENDKKAQIQEGKQGIKHASKSVQELHGRSCGIQYEAPESSVVHGVDNSDPRKRLDASARRESAECQRPEDE